MSAEYERMRKLAKQDPGTSGDQGEENWAELLSRWLPGTFHVVTKGRIISSYGKTSRQMDVLVLSPSYPRGLLSNKLYIAAGVLAAFECKRTLRRENIQRAVHTGVELSRMVRSDYFAPHSILYGLLAHSHQIPSSRRSPVTVVSDILWQEHETEVHDPHECLDFICVPDLGAWCLAHIMLPPSSNKQEETLATVHMGPRDDSESKNGDAIGYFLVSLLRRIGKIDSSVAGIAHYLEAPHVGLLKEFKGQLRLWQSDRIPDDLRELVWNGPEDHSQE